jgi:hypothetical protein
MKQLHPLRRRGRWAGTPAALAALLGVSAAAAHAQIPGKFVPDVQVVVAPRAGGEWVVSAVYSKRVPRAQAEGRVKRLLGLTGWKGTQFEFEERALERDAKKLPADIEPLPPVPVMSSLTFLTGGKVVDMADGTMPLEPFARAYRDLNRIHVTYLVPGKFAFKGLRRFADNNVDIALSEGQGAWTYVVNIKNHRLDSLGLPRYEVLKSERAVQSAQASPGGLRARKTLFGTGLVVLLAAGAGAVAYLWTNRLAMR